MFVDITDFENPKAVSILVPDHLFYSVRKYISEKLKKEGNDLQNFEQDMTNFNYLEIKPLKPENESKEINPDIIENLSRSH